MFGNYKSQIIGGQKEKFVRLEDANSDISFKSDMAGRTKYGFNIEGHATNPSKSIKLGVKRGSEGLVTFGRTLKSGVTRAVFPEDLRVSDKRIFDPQDKSLLFWNRLLVISCILAVSIDPLFLYLPVFKDEGKCLHIDESLATIVSWMRTAVDLFYLIRMVLQFRTAFIAPSSRVFGRGELVIDPKQIATRYLSRYFVVDFFSILPAPQIVIWRYLGGSRGSDVLITKTLLSYIILIQYIPRFLRFIPLSSDLKKTAGVFAETAWAGAAYYLLWFVLASHIFGAIWYLLAVERKDTCWNEACTENDQCKDKLSYLYCSREGNFNLTEWQNIGKSVLDEKCAEEEKFSYGIYARAVTTNVLDTEDFVIKYCFCLWWGLQNLSTLGQGLETSTYTKENLFSIILAISGLLLFALLIGNMQTYLQSLTVRLEEMRVKRRDSEQWMHHRVLPPELRERVRRYDQYKWLETRGVDEESLVQNLPKDLRRDIKRHLCLNLVRRVPLFENMDERMLDAICERLKPSLCTERTYIVREGDPVGEMMFIIRGRLESVTTDGGRSGFFNRGILKENDFCGEELLTWALDPKSGSNLPPSTRTVKALTEVEAFALEAEEVKYITSQFRRLQSRQVQHTFRFYSQQWRTWAASFIQAAWRRHTKRKIAELRQIEEMEEDGFNENDDGETEFTPMLHKSPERPY
ncbi:putative cyclic nucleotide-gated ion channel 8 [Solanum pennellii]|uniref:Cyclic nucleotide-gated ion channel 8 n=1 Tax=Solanum pennellii TaxID=28526 RepID=A0ABM1V774_SOLPN|nr:putative cyclic nucleotide-gated ion channel 8 [Solanum pennellii]XP_027771589.1 putative cyclic nucleotide-gated ion channel 8 [Solanum pennellii]XP_027771591.1 putative cyclic nucleotide-gated ion channel 8 [Solanum pennellii]XP_027771592.1 putative cyclic nucleotide-gated ion channel 8 [Solanum pennellii]